MPPHLTAITTPLNYDAWQLWLNYHPDQDYASYLLDGIAHGFRIGFKHTSNQCLSATGNHPSANEHPLVISQAIALETQAGRLIGPLDPKLFPFAHVSSLGAVPKKHSDNKWRLILDLSHPKHHSVNDGIDRSLCSLSYTKVDFIVQRILSSGQETLLDIESAFRNIPVHPHDRHLLGMLWESQLYIDTVLPFGLRSAPKIFNAIADGLQWVALERGVSNLDHFLDDFIITGKPNTDECKNNLQLLVHTCAILNLPLALSKLDGPTTCLTFLGIVLDTQLLQMRLPNEKLLRLKSTLSKWGGLKCCIKKELQSLIGLLHDASIVIRPGRTFIRRLLDLLKASHFRPAKAPIRLNVEARSDILWWKQFNTDWNGLSMMQDHHRANPEIILTSDASGSWGCGAHWQSCWFQHQWSKSTSAYDITTKELLPIVFAAAIWGPYWQSKSVLCLCDNIAVVSIINTGTSKNNDVMALMRCLFFITAKHNLLLTATHLPGSSNTLADALSRNKLPLFFSNFPQACPLPSHIPPALTDLLVLSKPDWTSPSWSSMFNATFKQHFQKTQSPHTAQHTEGTSCSATELNIPPTPQQKTSCPSLPLSLPHNTLNTKPQKGTYLESVTTRSFSHTQTPLSTTCLDYNTSSGESGPLKQKKI